MMPRIRVRWLGQGTILTVIPTLLDLLNIPWERSKKLNLPWYDADGTRRRYCPDFRIINTNIYIDPKNPYKFKLDADKIESVRAEHENIDLWVGGLTELNDRIMKYCFGY